MHDYATATSPDTTSVLASFVFAEAQCAYGRDEKDHDTGVHVQGPVGHEKCSAEDGRDHPASVGRDGSDNTGAGR